jgi:TRAP-type uncharacterized transport system fused permease subunit
LGRCGLAPQAHAAPVCTSAYASAAIAGANPWKTGFAAVRLSNAKILVPFVFCYSPALLLVLPDFTWMQFLQTALTCGGVMLLGMAFTGFIARPIASFMRVPLGLAGLLLVHPGGVTDVMALLIAVPILFRELAWPRLARVRRSNAAS